MILIALTTVPLVYSLKGLPTRSDFAVVVFQWSHQLYAQRQLGTWLAQSLLGLPRVARPRARLL